jgi:myo-inositol-1(or 4)-monophosphatase
MTYIPALPITLRDMKQIAHEAGEIMKKHFTPFGMKRKIKGDRTPVTLADNEINEMAVRRVRRLSVEVDIIGEEESDRRDSPWILMIDPIDGTFPFTWGMPTSTFMIGLAYRGISVLGVIYDPHTGRMYSAQKGFGAWMNESRLSVSTVAQFDDHPVVGYVSMPGIKYNIRRVCMYLEERGVVLVNFLSIGYMEMMVATGEWAGTIFPWEHTHDTLQGHIIVEEAGGKVTDLFGNPIVYGPENRMRGHIMSNGRIHDLLVDAVRMCN